jgi:hypothetical protein
VQPRRIHLDPPEPVYVKLHVNGWDPLREVPALLHEWRATGPEGARHWRGRVFVAPADALPSWNPNSPWYDAELLRPREG